MKCFVSSLFYKPNSLFRSDSHPQSLQLFFYLSQRCLFSLFSISFLEQFFLCDLSFSLFPSRCFSMISLFEEVIYFSPVFSLSSGFYADFSFQKLSFIKAFCSFVILPSLSLSLSSSISVTCFYFPPLSLEEFYFLVFLLFCISFGCKVLFCFQ